MSNEEIMKRRIWIVGVFPLGSLTLMAGTLDLSIVIPVQLLFLAFPLVGNIVLLKAGFVLNQRGIKGWAFAALLMSVFPVILAIASYSDIVQRGMLTLTVPILLGFFGFAMDCIALGFLARRTGKNTLFAWAVIAAILALTRVGEYFLWFDIFAAGLFIILLAPRKKESEWGPRALGKERRRILAILTAVGVVSAGVIPYMIVGLMGDFDHPRFIRSDFVELAKIGNVSRFRSHAGHEYVDSYESGERSMKHYFKPTAPYANSSWAIEVYAPADAFISNIAWEGHQNLPGQLRGFHLDLMPTSAPFYRITIFHVNITAGLFPGALLRAGQFLGYADIRNASDFDISIALLLPFGTQRYVSYFAVMEDQLFAKYQSRGIATRDQAIITRDASDAAEGVEMPLSWDWITLT